MQAEVRRTPTAVTGINWGGFDEVAAHGPEFSGPWRMRGLGSFSTHANANREPGSRN